MSQEGKEAMEKAILQQLSNPQVPNPVVGAPAQTPTPEPQGATEEIKPLSDGDLTGLSPEWQARVKKYVDSAVNAKSMIAEATKRNEEASALQKKLDEQMQYLNERDEELQSREQELLDRIQELASRATTQPIPTPTPTTQMPDISQDPNAALQYVINELKSTKEMTAKEITELKKTIESERTKQADEANKKSFFEMLDKNIFSKYPDVKLQDLQDYYDKHRGMPVDDFTLGKAAEEITTVKRAEKEKWVQEHLAQKEAQAKNVQIQPGASVGTIEPVKGFSTLKRDEQEAIIADMLRKEAKNMGIELR